ncbi:MAG: hypothetical protein KAJ86_03735 [Alphaproteobacteria bacterium]|nr:hypothetical protein [Alphaproteobacteria bacterium]
MVKDTKTVLEQVVDAFLHRAYEKHVEPGFRNKTNEFINLNYGRNLGIENPEKFKTLVMDTLNDPKTMAVVANKDGSHIYFYNEKNNVFVFIDPKGSGTVFRPPDKIDYFNGRVNKVIDKLEPENFLKVDSGGFPALNNAFTEKFGHLPKIGFLSQLGQIFDTAIDIIPRPVAKLLKILPIAGTAVTFMASRAECADMREKAYDMAVSGDFPPKFLEDFELVLKAHMTQANFDMSMVLNEGGVQKMFDTFSRKYGLNEETQEKLRPQSLVEYFKDKIELFKDKIEPPVSEPAVSEPAVMQAMAHGM